MIGLMEPVYAAGGINLIYIKYIKKETMKIELFNSKYTGNRSMGR